MGSTFGVQTTLYTVTVVLSGKPREFSNISNSTSHLAKILKDKGYAYQFVYSKGAGHAQRKVIDDTLPQALEYVWLDYTPRR